MFSLTVDFSLIFMFSCVPYSERTPVLMKITTIRPSVREHQVVRIVSCDILSHDFVEACAYRYVYELAASGP